MLLHIVANPRPRGQSRSIRVADALLEGYRESNPNAKVVEFNLFSEDLPMVDEAGVNTRIHQAQGQQLEGEEKKRFDLFMKFIEPLQKCDRLVITSPMWNFGPPWKLKQWIDTVTQARVTFEYTADGPRGLLKCEKAAIVGSRGGMYPENGDPRETRDFLTTYLNAALKWIGIDEIQTCFADGVDAKRDQQEEIVKAAAEKAKRIGKSF